MAGEARSYSEGTETERLLQIVDLGRQHVCDRFADCPDVQRKLRDARITAEPGQQDDLAIGPPRRDGEGYLITFTPSGIARLASEHRHPEWVVCAKLEVLILASPQKWDGTDEEIRDLVAHRERVRAPRATASRQ